MWRTLQAGCANAEAPKPLLNPTSLPFWVLQCPVWISGKEDADSESFSFQSARICSTHSPALAAAALWPVGGATQPLPQAAKVGSLMATLHNSAPLLLSLFLPDTHSLPFVWITFLCYGIWVVFPSLPAPAADS